MEFQKIVTYDLIISRLKSKTPGINFPGVLLSDLLKE